VRQVITLGSPFKLAERGPDRSAAARVYRSMAPMHAANRIHSARGVDRSLPVPSTSVYSRWDGVVDWRACLQPVTRTSENVAVHASHLGMGYDPAVLWVVADRLAQTEGGWRPFRRPTRFGLGALFPEDEPDDVSRPPGARRRPAR
jgi:hypothetical protein